MRRISILSFFAVLISVSVFLIVLFVMNGMNKSIQNRIVQLDPNITLESKDRQTYDLSGIQEARSLSFDSYDLIVRTFDGQFRGTHAVGYNQSDFQYWLDRLAVLKKKDSTDFEFTADLEPNEIVVGIEMARSLGLLDGDQVTLIPVETLLISQTEKPIFEKVTVKKIVTSDLPEVDSGVIFFNKENSLANLKQSASKTSGYHLWVDHQNQMSGILDQLKTMNFKSIETWREKNSSLFFALMMEKTMIGIILGLAGLIASTSILTVLALIMSQKQSDIAIIKAVGLSNKRTLILFTQIGLWISLSAVFIGMVIGLSVSYYLQYYPLQILPQIYYDSSIPALVDLKFAFIVFIVSLILAILGCYLPARATLGIQPALLLKNKN